MSETQKPSAELLALVTREVFEDYERIRSDGDLNMHDYAAVTSFAISDLCFFTLQQYVLLQKNYSALRAYYTAQPK